MSIDKTVATAAEAVADIPSGASIAVGGFGLSGEQDLSGTAQAGIAYALGNSAQVSLSYKYFGLDYAGGGGNAYSVDQSGVNLGLRWLFD